MTAGTAVAAQPGGFTTADVATADHPTDGTDAPPNGTADNATDGTNASAGANATAASELPAGVENFTATSPLRGTQTDPASLAGKLRVESEHLGNTSVELIRNSSTDFTLAINVTGNASNVSFYLQTTAFAASQNLSNVTAQLDGEPLALGSTEANNSSWIGFEIDHFSTRTVAFDLPGNATNGTDGNLTDGNATDGNATDGNATDGANATSGPVDGRPTGVENFTATSPLRGTQTDPASLAGKLRVESQYAANTSVELLRNSSTDFKLAVNVTGNASNVSFYLQTTAFAASQNLSNVTATLDGEPLTIGAVDANNSSWIAFEIDHFSTRTVAFDLPGNASDGNVTDGNATDGNATDGNATDGNATDRRTAAGEPPAGVANFTDTSALRGTQTDPANLAGKLRVESQYAANTSVKLIRNSSTNFTLAVNVTGGASNVSFYLQTTAFAASQNLSNVTATLDGEPLALGSTEANNSSWIGFEIDHFSTRVVTFELAGNATNGTGGAAPAGPPALPGAANAPIDADGDGLYEDVSGDGSFNVVDVATLLSELDSAAVKDNAAAFDFDGSGGVNVIDVAALLEEL